MQFLNDRLFKKDDVTRHDLTDLTNMGSSRDPPNLKIRTEHFEYAHKKPRKTMFDKFRS